MAETKRPVRTFEVPATSTGTERADLFARIARIRWAVVGLSLLMVKLTDPRPISPVLLVVMTLLMIPYNVPLTLARRIPAPWLERLGLASLVVDFLVCSAWVAMTGNDPTATVYVVFMVAAVEAAVLYYWRGTIAYVAAFVIVFSLVYVEKWSLFHEPLLIGSTVFRFAIVIVMAVMSGSLASASERRRSTAEALAVAAMTESARLETVYQLARGLGASLRRDDVLANAAGAMQLLFPERWSGVLLEDGNGTARLVAGTGHPDVLEVAIPDVSVFPVGETLIFEDFWNSPLLRDSGIVIPESLRVYASAAVVPLHIRDVRLGALVVLGMSGEKFSLDEVRVLEAVTPQISTALENSRLYQEAENLSLTDTLTGLSNRRAFDQRIAEEISRWRRQGRPLSLVIFDIDYFKVYNDTHGHQAGDDILRRLGMVLPQRMLRQTDLGFRYGGEEFAVIMPETTAAQAQLVMERVHQMLAEEPLPLGDHQPGGHLTVSAGIAECLIDGCTAADLVEQADLALFGAKQSGRNRSLVYESELSLSLTNWTRVLPGILENRSLHSIYQPILRLADNTVFAYEALARPDEFEDSASVEGMFAAAQRMGLLHDIDWLCFRTAIKGASLLPRGYELFVNISVAALLDFNNSPEFLRLVLRQSRREAVDVVLEISEREAVTDTTRLTAILEAYRAEGFRFALDDVGDGHSTFELLAAAEPEYVKIARSLVINSASSGAAGTIRALVEFARSTGSGVVAEGIADLSTADRMRDLGVEFGQGFALGMPAALPQSQPAARARSRAAVR